MPLLLRATCFGGGATLLFSGALSSVPGRLRDLSAVVPLPFIEASHLAASLVGTKLLLIAPGATFSLFKGIDQKEGMVCLTIAGLLQLTKGAFYRRTSLVGRPLSPAWLASIAAVVGTDVSRFLRASLGITVTLAAAGLWWLFQPAPVRALEGRAPAEIAAILATARRTDAMLALTGDKYFLVSCAGRGLVQSQPVDRAEWSWRSAADAPIEGQRFLLADSSRRRAATSIPSRCTL